MNLPLTGALGLGGAAVPGAQAGGAAGLGAAPAVPAAGWPPGLLGSAALVNAGAVPPGAPCGVVLPGGTADNPLAIGVTPAPAALTLPLNAVRQVTMRNLEISRQTTAPVSVVAEVDVSRLQALRERAKQEFQQALGAPLTYLPFFMRATTRALQAFPVLNGVLTPTGFIIPRQINLGFAVQTAGGVVLPTIYNTERKSAAELAREIFILSQKARMGILTAPEMANQTFVITNTGRWGQSLFGTPVIKPPNVGSLAFEAIVKRPVVVENDQIAVRPMMYIVLTADHRAVDGREMVGFLGKVKESLENLQF